MRIVDLQMKDIAAQMQALDAFVTRARSQNAWHHNSHVRSLAGLSTHVKSSYADVGSHFTSTYERVRGLGEEMSAKTALMQNSLAPLDTAVNQPLAELRSIVLNTALQEYQPTGETPQKVQYLYPMELPRTEAHETLLTALRRPANASPSKTTTIPVIFNDDPEEDLTPEEDGERQPAPALGLREIDVNINAGSHPSGEDGISVVAIKPAVQQPHPSKEPLAPIPGFKRSASAGKLAMPRSARTTTPVVALEGRENAVFSQSTGRRRSPRLG